MPQAGASLLQGPLATEAEAVETLAGASLQVGSVTLLEPVVSPVVASLQEELVVVLVVPSLQEEQVTSSARVASLAVSAGLAALDVMMTTTEWKVRPRRIVVWIVAATG